MDWFMIPVVILSFALIIIGIICHGKRLEIYEEYSEYFGAFKAYCFLTFWLFGCFAIVMGIISMFVEGFTTGLGMLFPGLICLGLGILMGYLTNKKAKENGDSGVIKNMIVAGFGTFWHIELWILKICCFVWLIRIIFHRDDD